MKIEKTEVYGFTPALRGMRNPLNSWNKSDNLYFDNIFDNVFNNENIKYVEGIQIGKNDLNLAQTLIKAGGEHCKFLRMIQVWVDLTLPRFIWSEFDTYHYNTKNSCSTMHKLFDKNHILSSDDFELSDTSNVLSTTHNIETIHKLNILRERYFNATTQQEKNQILTIAKEILPESYLQKRTINTNYAELRNIYFQRKHHRLKEWHTICAWIEVLPYSRELITFE